MQPHSYIILPPLAAQLLHLFIPSILHWFSHHTWRLPVLNSQPLYPQLRRLNLQTINACPTLDCLYIWIILVRIAPSQKFTPSLLNRFTPSEQNTPSLLHHFTPLGSSTLSSFYPLWINYPLTLTPIYPPWQPNSYIILPPLNKLPPPPHSFNQMGRF